MLRERPVMPYVTLGIALAGGVGLAVGLRALIAPQIEVHTIEVPVRMVEAVYPVEPEKTREDVPSRALACSDGGNLRAGETGPVICADASHCVEMSPGSWDAKAVVPPAEVAPWQSPVPSIQNARTCLGTTCRDYGPKLRARIDAAPAGEHIEATSDLEAVVVGRRELWSVEKDRTLALSPVTSTSREPEQLTEIHVAGNAVIADWANCAGPCAMAVVMDSKGKELTALDGNASLTQLDANHFVYLSEWGETVVFEMSGRVVAKTDLGADYAQAQVVRLGDTSFAVLSGVGRDGATHLVTVDNYGDTLQVSPTRTIPPCRAQP